MRGAEGERAHTAGLMQLERGEPPESGQRWSRCGGGAAAPPARLLLSCALAAPAALSVGCWAVAVTLGEAGAGAHRGSPSSTRCSPF